MRPVVANKIALLAFLARLVSVTFALLRATAGASPVYSVAVRFNSLFNTEVDEEPCHWLLNVPSATTKKGKIGSHWIRPNVRTWTERIPLDMATLLDMMQD